MKIHQIKPKNTTLKDFKSLRKQTSKSEPKNIEKSWGCYGLSNIIDDFAEPIVISKKEMKDYAKQVAKRVAAWKKILG